MASSTNSKIAARWREIRQQSIEICQAAKSFSECRVMTHSIVIPIRITKELHILSFMIQQAEAPAVLLTEELLVTHALSLAAYIKQSFDQVYTFLEAFEPVTRLEFFARENEINRMFNECLHALQKSTEDIGNFLFDGGTILRRTREEYSAVFHDQEYFAGIVYDQDGASNKKVRLVLKELGRIGMEEKIAETESSVNNMMWATAHYESWARVAAVQKCLAKLAKQARCNVLEIVKTIFQFWYECGFNDDDSHLKPLIERAVKESKEDKASTQQRLSELVLVSYAGYREGSADENGIYSPPAYLNQESEPPSACGTSRKYVELPNWFKPGISDDEQWSTVLQRIKKVHQLVTVTQVYAWTRDRLLPIFQISDLRRVVEKYFYKEEVKQLELELEDDSDDDSGASYNSTDEEVEETDEGSAIKTKHIITPEQCTLHVEGIWGPTSMLRAVYTLPKVDDIARMLVALQEHRDDLVMATECCKVMTQLATRGPPQIIEYRTKMISDVGGLAVFLNVLDIHEKVFDFVIVVVECLGAICAGSVDVARRGIQEERLPLKFCQLLHDFPGGLIKVFSKIQYTVYKAIMNFCLTGGNDSREFFAREGVAKNAMKALKGANMNEVFVQYTCGALLQISKYKKIAYELICPPETNTVTSAIVGISVTLLSTTMVQKSDELMFVIVALVNQVLDGASSYRNEDISNTQEIKYPLEASILELTRIIFRVMTISENPNLVKRCLSCLTTCSNVSTKEVKLEVAQLGVHLFLLNRLEEWLTEPPSTQQGEKMVDPNQAIFGLQSIISVTSGPTASAAVKELVLENNALLVLRRALNTHAFHSEVHTNVYLTLHHFMMNCEETFQLFLRDNGHAQLFQESIKRFLKKPTLVLSAASCVILLVQSFFDEIIEDPEAVEKNDRQVIESSDNVKLPVEQALGTIMDGEKIDTCVETESTSLSQLTEQDATTGPFHPINPRQAVLIEDGLGYLLKAADFSSSHFDIEMKCFECIALLLSQSPKDRICAERFTSSLSAPDTLLYILEKLNLYEMYGRICKRPKNEYHIFLVTGGGFLVKLIAAKSDNNVLYRMYKQGFAKVFHDMLCADTFADHPKAIASLCGGFTPFARLETEQISEEVCNNFSENQGISLVLKAAARYSDDRCLAVETMNLVAAIGQNEKRMRMTIEKRGGVHASLSILQNHENDLDILYPTMRVVLMLVSHNPKLHNKFVAGNFIQHFNQILKNFGRSSLRFYILSCKLAELFSLHVSPRKIMQDLRFQDTFMEHFRQFTENPEDPEYILACKHTKLTVSQIKSRV